MMNLRQGRFSAHTSVLCSKSRMSVNDMVAVIVSEPSVHNVLCLAN